MNTMQTLLPLTLSALSALVACNPQGPGSDDKGDTNVVADSTDTGSADTGSADTGSADTGNTDTGSEDTGSEDTGDTGEAAQEPASPEDFAGLVIDARDQLTQTFTMDASAGGNFLGDKGTTLFIWGNSLQTAGGSPVTGDVDVELIEIYDKGSMLVADMPSAGRLPSGETAQLISGGEHYVNASQEGDSLELISPFFLMAPADATGGVDEDMSLFRAESDIGVAADIDDQALWVEEEADDAAFGIDREGGADGGDAAGSYWMLSSQFAWSNIDKWYSDPRPKTTIHVDVPDGWDSDNCSVYLSYDGEPTALAGFDVYNPTTELFTEHYGLIPIGLEVHVILVTESEGQWSYAIQGQTIEADHLTVFESADDFIETDMDGLVSAINALP